MHIAVRVVLDGLVLIVRRYMVVAGEGGILYHAVLVVAEMLVAAPARVVGLHDVGGVPADDDAGVGPVIMGDRGDTHLEVLSVQTVRLAVCGADDRHPIAAGYGVVIAETQGIVRGLGVYLEPLRRVAGGDGKGLSAFLVPTRSRQRLDIRIARLVGTQVELITVQSDE